MISAARRNTCRARGLAGGLDCLGGEARARRRRGGRAAARHLNRARRLPSPRACAERRDARARARGARTKIASARSADVAARLRRTLRRSPRPSTRTCARAAGRRSGDTNWRRACANAWEGCRLVHRQVSQPRVGRAAGCACRRRVSPGFGTAVALVTARRRNLQRPDRQPLPSWPSRGAGPGASLCAPEVSSRAKFQARKAKRPWFTSLGSEDSASLRASLAISRDRIKALRHCARSRPFALRHAISAGVRPLKDTADAGEVELLRHFASAGVQPLSTLRAMPAR